MTGGMHGFNFLCHLKMMSWRHRNVVSLLSLIFMLKMCGSRTKLSISTLGSQNQNF